MKYPTQKFIEFLVNQVVSHGLDVLSVGDIKIVKTKLTPLPKLAEDGKTPLIQKGQSIRELEDKVLFGNH